MKIDNKNSLILYIAFLSGMQACSEFLLPRRYRLPPFPLNKKASGR
jgi:hypothetical protein